MLIKYVGEIKNFFQIEFILHLIPKIPSCEIKTFFANSISNAAYCQWNVVTNVLDTESRIANGLSSSLGVGRGANNSSP